MLNTIKLKRNLENEIDSVIMVFLGDTVDEEGVPYRNVYKHELSSFLDYVEAELDRLVKLKIPISYIEVRNALINAWGMGIDEDYNINELNDLANKLYNCSLNVETEKIKLSSELSEMEEEFIKMTLMDETENLKKRLISIRLKDEPLFETLKKVDEKKYQDMVQRIIKEYITGVNTLYKLYRKSPKDWETGYSLHKGIVDYFEIEESQFVFE